MTIPFATNAPTVFTTATSYVMAGLSVIPVATDGSKAPEPRLLPVVTRRNGTVGPSWEPYQERLPTYEEIANWFYYSSPLPGIGIVGGAVSGGLEVVDVDIADLAWPWFQHVRQANPSLADRLLIVQTPSGYHFYFRSAAPSGNQKLAQRHEVDPFTHERKVKTLIETKGRGGYTVAPGSPPYCHPTGRQYLLCHADRDFTRIPTITAEERETLFSVARQFNQIQPRQGSAPPTPRAGRVVNLGRPGDDFNTRGDWRQLLSEHGWTFLYSQGDGKQCWSRPGKDYGVSATLNFNGSDRLFVFSTNAPSLEASKSYSKFEFLAAVEHDGDFRAAAQALRAAGFGRQKMREGRRRRPRRSTGSRRNRQRRHRRR